MRRIFLLGNVHKCRASENFPKLLFDFLHVEKNAQKNNEYDSSRLEDELKNDGGVHKRRLMKKDLWTGV